MQLDKLLDDLSKNKIKYKPYEPMRNHTTFKIGGNADVFISVGSEQELKTVLSAAKECETPCFILGRGSNLLVSDGGIEGAVVSLDAFDSIEVRGDTLVCGAGASLKKVCLAARDASLSGLEFAYGIPGTVGGALYMNAGAYGGDMSQAVKSAQVYDRDGNKKNLNAEQMKLGYRTSVFKSTDLIITSVEFELKRGNYADIKAAMDDFLNRRRDKQPLEYPSAGSTFKRPTGNFAGTLIEKNNLKGVSVGGAQVSEKHAGFVINTGGASCRDVLTLIKKIQNTVKQADGIDLEPEVIFVGRE